uniref:G patch domain-containing protein 11-like n=1 Tax=Nicotiana sylvestris TaxID=4096 RepID=A0A1U7WIW4_NICSY|nr:PREDICTED: G patch domain-containing protein 11-like [Nicotiana sylvestris]
MSNLGFKLLKKLGGREGTGLGIAEHDKLEPVPAYIKKNKRGLEAEKSKKAA